MAEPDVPNRKSRMEKAEGDRRDEADAADRDTAITNRVPDEETMSQKRGPERDGSKPGAHGG